MQVSKYSKYVYCKEDIERYSSARGSHSAEAFKFLGHVPLGKNTNLHSSPALKNQYLPIRNIVDQNRTINPIIACRTSSAKEFCRTSYVLFRCTICVGIPDKSGNLLPLGLVAFTQTAMTLLSLLGGLLLIKSAVTTIVEPEWKIYYNLTTNQTIDIIDSNNPRVSFYKHQQQRILRIGFGPIPCSCQGLTCGCCSGINIQYYNFNQKACMNFTYDPYEFELLVNMLMNDESLFMQSISGKNPPPACIPFSMPLLPQVNFCLKFFNIHTPGYNLFMCIDFETRIQSTPILILHFDCMQMGADGIQHHKPEDAEILPIEAPNENNQQGPEIYDEVFEEEENKTSTAKPKQALTQNTEKLLEKDDAYDDEIC